jgi:hypothetical protein
VLAQRIGASTTMLVATADTGGLVPMTTFEVASRFISAVAFSTAVAFDGVHTPAALQVMFWVDLLEIVTAAPAAFTVHSNATQRSVLRQVIPRI